MQWHDQNSTLSLSKQDLWRVNSFFLLSLLDEMKVNSYVNANMGEVPSPQLQTCPICTKVCKGLHLYRHMKIHSKEEIAKAKEGAINSSSPQLQPQQQQHKRPQMKISSGEAQAEIDYEKGMEAAVSLLQAQDIELYE